jgi:hypothetical protein
VEYRPEDRRGEILVGVRPAFHSSYLLGFVTDSEIPKRYERLIWPNLSKQAPVGKLVKSRSRRVCTKHPGLSAMNTAGAARRPIMAALVSAQGDRRAATLFDRHRKSTSSMVCRSC